jgi:hypothetical protein
MWREKGSRNTCNFHIDHALNIDLSLGIGKHSNIIIEVLCESVITSRRNVKYADASLANTLPEPFGVEYTTTSFPNVNDLQLEYASSNKFKGHCMMRKNADRLTSKLQ